MNPSDTGRFFSRLLVVATECRFCVTKLGEAFGFPLLLLSPPVVRSSSKPNLLVAAGFHGEEQAGPWGLLHFLETMAAGTFINNYVSYLPLVNPSGFQKARRCNDAGDSPNAGFIPQDPTEKLSIEGQALKAAEPLFSQLASDGFLSLHEQTHEAAFYTYALEDGKVPSKRALALRDAGRKFFPLAKDGLILPPGGGKVKDGVVLNYHDGTFEDFMFKKGVPQCYTTETPILAPFELRVSANAYLIQQFIASARS